MRKSLRHLTLVTASALLLAGASVAQAVQTTSPSTTVTPYLDTHLPNVTVESILTVDDGSVAKTGGGTTRMVGIPDGLGVVDGSEMTPADPNVFYLLVNHEIGDTQGVVRDHGQAGSFISKWKVDKATHEVVEGDDLIKQAFSWNGSSYVNDSIVFNRMCSADRPASSALYNPATGNGSQEILYINGEETAGGRAFAHVVTGVDAGNSYHLPHLGYAAFENVVLNPAQQDATVAVMTDDASNGEVYVYVGNKQATGSEPEKAGLVGGNLYALSVIGKPYELDNDLGLAVAANESFELKLIGEPGNYPVDGADTEARGADTVAPLDPTQTFASLKMGGPEDGVWDTRAGFEHIFYFATKGTSSNGITAPTRLWQLAFNDIANPTAGGTMTLLLDGPENRLGSLDNMTFDMIAGAAKLYLQEDLGSDARLSKIWEYDIASGALAEIAAHDADRFIDGGPAFITTNEESSGIISLRDQLGEGWFAATVQVHSSAGLSDSAELVEHGQLVLIDINGRGQDLRRERIIASGDLWDYRVDGVDPGAGWNASGFTIDANWNVDTNGNATGALPTMLGYGEAAGVLNSDLGQPAAPRTANYYFRREFNLADPAAVTLFDLYMKADDGAVVYINGVEVARYNLNLDLVVDNATYASRNEPSERDWKRIDLTSADVNLQASGNVIAISMHQENANSSDLRMDVELIAWNASVDGGTAPAAPANLVAGNPTETSLDLSWDAVADAKFLRIERQADGDAAWEVIEAEYPGEFTSYVDGNVASGVTYHYRMVAHNIHGRSAQSATASGTTVSSLLPVIFEENFDIPDSFGQFTLVDVAEPAKGWSWLLWDFGSTGAVQGNNYGDGAGPTEDWLITTTPINFLFYQEESLKYDSQISFGGPAPQVLLSTDYDPLVDADPNAATWSLINEDTSSHGSLTPVGPFDLSGVSGTGYLAFKYTGDGSSGGQSVRFTLDDVIIKGSCGYDFVGAENSDIEADTGSPWTVVNNNSAYGWQYDTRDGEQAAINNNFGSGAGGILGGTASDDWLISPPLALAGPISGVDFRYYEKYGDTLAQPLSVLVTDSYNPADPMNSGWIDITPTALNGSTDGVWIDVSSQSFGLTGNNIRVAFRYQSAGNGGGTTKRIGVDQVCIVARGGPLEAGLDFTRNGPVVSFIPTVTGGNPPYRLDWDFGDGTTSTEDAPSHEYTAVGSYAVNLIVTDEDGSQVVINKPDYISVTQFLVPEKLGLRVATYNVSMNRSTADGLANSLADGSDSQIQRVAEAIQRARPDIILLNEFDQVYDANGYFDRYATEQLIDNFKNFYLAVPQADDVEAIGYDYHFVRPVNTGVPSGFDLDNDGRSDGPGDGYGFGAFPGQYGMVVLSKYRIKYEDVRSFQMFRWKDMPGALLPTDPNDTDGDGDTSSFYSDEELEVFRLSSKSHWDIPVKVPGVGKVHILASHPTPPVFDDGTADVQDNVADWNGLRNHDEIRFWADYINPRKSRYIYDDRAWRKAGNRKPRMNREGRYHEEDGTGGLEKGKRFIIVGDQNADPVDGDATYNPIMMLLDNRRIDTSLTPVSDGALEQVPASATDPETKTASFNLRADYALPAERGLDLEQAWVFWPLSTDLEADLLSASDHRMVVIDVSKQRKHHKKRWWKHLFDKDDDDRERDRKKEKEEDDD